MATTADPVVARCSGRRVAVRRATGAGSCPCGRVRDHGSVTDIEPIDTIEFEIHARPGGSRDAVDGAHDGALAVRVSAPPAGGQANRALCRTLAKTFQVPASAVEVVGGQTSRRKRMRIHGDGARLRALLDQLMAPTHP